MIAPRLALFVSLSVAATVTPAQAQKFAGGIADRLDRTCAESGSVEIVGLATSGSAGLLDLELSGAPLEGLPFHLRVTSGRPFANGCLVYSPNELPLYLPKYGATAYPTAPFSFAVFATDSFGSSPPLLGMAPVTVDLCGLDFVTQAVVFDPLALGGVAFTKAMRIGFGGPPSGPLLPAPLLHVGNNPVRIQQAHVDGDGILDLVVGLKEASYLNGAIVVLLGHADGTFTILPPLFLGSTLEDISVGDVNEDGHMDVLAALSYQTKVLLGVGDGTFVTAPNLSFTPDVFELADLDADGSLDVVMLVDDYVQICIGKGDGTFIYGQRIYFHSLVHDPVIAELTGDQHVDIAVGSDTPGTIAILRGFGDGTFLFASDFSVGGYRPAVVALDLNADGRNDLAVASDDEVSVHLGQGGGGFLLTGSVPLPGAAVLESVDFDGDGDLDLAVGSLTEVAILQNDGLGGLTESMRTWVGGRITDLVIEDHDGDGDPDVVVTNSYEDSVVLMAGNSSGTVAATTSLAGPDAPMAVAIVDLNGDQIDDVVSVNLFSDDVTAFLGLGGGAFSSSVRTPVSGQLVEFDVGDVNGDGVPDLAIARSYFGGVSIMRGVGDGTFVEIGVVLNGSTMADVDLADLDLDGKLDLVAVISYGDAEVYRGNGDGTFAHAGGLGGNQVRAVTIVDLNADGLPDAVVSQTSGPEVIILLRQPGATFVETDRLALPDTPYGAVAGDLDGDGTLDLAVNVWGTGGDLLFHGHGDGTFSQSDLVEEATGSGSLAVADMDRDGLSDLVKVSSGICLYRSRGDGTVEPPLIFMSDLLSPLAIGDLDGDAMPDLVVQGGPDDGLLVVPHQMLRQ